MDVHVRRPVPAMTIDRTHDGAPGMFLSLERRIPRRGRTLDQA